MDPFDVGKVAHGASFTNREKERARLKQNIQSKTSTILISPRRWGKSSLVAQTAQELSKADPTIVFCFIDLFKTRSEKDFFDVFAQELIKATSSKLEERIANVKKFVKGLIPRFNIGLDPVNDFSMTFDWQEGKRRIGEILDLPEALSKDKGCKVVVCLDEFQNVAFYEDPIGFQKTLRAHWQHHQHANYVLYGSKRHMMTEIFENKSMPFYKFGDIMLLQKIAEEDWVAFITKSFRAGRKEISQEVARTIAKTVENHPYFVQLLCKQLWHRTDDICTEELVAEVVQDLVMQYEIMYVREIEGLTKPQIGFLRAICDQAPKLSAAETLAAYGLGTSANVIKMKASLENKEIIDTMGTSIEILDPLFKVWLKSVYFK